MAAISSTELARRCGVSQGTVDRALHGRAGISAATRQRVLDEAARLGYLPHHGARALITGSDRLIGLILFGIDNHFTARVIRAVEEASRAAGYELLVALSNRDPARERAYLRRFLERRVDGVILFPVTRACEELNLAGTRKVPIVSLFNRVEAPRVNCLSLDEPDAMRRLANRLSKTDCRRAAFVTYSAPPDQNTDALNSRRDSFLAAASAKGIEVNVSSIDLMPSDLDRYDAIVCHNDHLAMRVLRSFPVERTNGATPIVTGFDAADELFPGEQIAATFAVPYDGIAQAAVEIIHNKKFGKSRKFKVIPQWNHR